MFCPAVTSSWPAWPAEMPSRWRVRRRGRRDKLLELAVQRDDLAIERFDPLRDRAQRELPGLRRAAQLAG